MKVNELIQHLKQFPQNSEVVISSDEEMNTLYTNFQVAILEDVKNPSIVFFGLSGSELEEDF